MKTYRKISLKSDCKKEELSSLPFLITRRTSFVLLFTLVNIASWVLINLKFELMDDKLNSLWKSLGPLGYLTLLSLVDSVILGGFQWLVLRNYFSKGSYKWIIFVFISMFLSAINNLYLMQDKFVFQIDRVYFSYGVQIIHALLLTYLQLLVVKEYAVVNWKKFLPYFLSIFSYIVLSDIAFYVYYTQSNKEYLGAVESEILRTVLASTPMGLLLSFIFIRFKALPIRQK